VLADDHMIVREGLKLALGQRPDFVVAGEAADGVELMQLLREDEAPDVVILDISMPNLDGIEVLREMRLLHPRLRVLVLTMHREEDLLREAFLAGADGYLLKDDLAKELFGSIDAILEAKTYVSPTMRIELKDAWLKAFIAFKGAHPDEPLSSQEVDFLRRLARGE